MSSETVSQLIIFIAAILIAASVAGTLVMSADDITGIVSTQSDSLSDELQSEIKIISDPQSGAIYDDNSGEFTLLVKNLGGKDHPLSDHQLMVQINGELIHPDELEIEIIGSENEIWRSTQVLQVTGPIDLDEGDHRAKISLRGAEDMIGFRVTE